MPPEQTLAHMLADHRRREAEAVAAEHNEHRVVREAHHFRAEVGRTLIRLGRRLAPHQRVAA